MSSGVQRIQGFRCELGEITENTEAKDREMTMHLVVEILRKLTPFWGESRIPKYRP